MAEEDTEYLKLPIPEQCRHTLWKARLNGYQEAAKKFALMESKDKEWMQYIGLIKDMVTDSNAVAQDKGLDAALSFIENASIAPKTVGEVCGGVVQKCLGAPKAKTKEKGQAMMLMYIEVEKQDIVLEELVTATANKNPKVRAAALQTLKTAFNEFGAKVISPKPVMKILPTVLEDKDKNVREEAKQLAGELHRWMGSALKNCLQNLKPVMAQELDAEYAKSAGERVAPTRYLRSQQSAAPAANMAASTNGPMDASVHEGGDAPGPAAVDPWEFLEPIDALGRLQSERKNFAEDVASKKWSERKESVDALLAIVENQRLDPAGNYGEVVGILKNMVAKDTNINVVSVAAKCLAHIAAGLRKKFNAYVGMCLPVVLEKFKEKKTVVRDALREAVDAMAKTASIESQSEEIVKALDNKNPLVKAETSLYLARFFVSSSPTVLNKKILKILCPALVQVLSDQDPTAREAAMEALGVAMRVVSEKAIQPFLTDVDQLKMTKIKEFSEKAELQGSAPGSAAAPSAAAPVRKAEAPLEADAPVQKKPKTAAAPGKAKPGAPPKGKKPGGGPPAGAKPKSEPTKSAPSQSQVFEERELSPEEVLSISEGFFDSVTVQIPDTEVSQKVLVSLVSTNWKERLVAIQKMLEYVKSQDDPSKLPCQAIIGILSNGKRKESNLYVLQARVELFQWLAENAKFSTHSLLACRSELVDKLPEKKDSIGDRCSGALISIAEALELKIVAEEVLYYAIEQQRNPKCQAEAFVWLVAALEAFGMKLDVKKTIGHLKKGLAATNQDVRQKAIAAIGFLPVYLGAQLRVFFEDEKPQVLALIDAESAKHKDEKPKPPTKGLKGGQAAAGDGATGKAQQGQGDVDNAMDVDEDEEEGFNVADLVERKDISGQLTDDLLSQVEDGNWKVRKEALDKILGIISEAKFITPSIGSLPDILKARLTESNRNVVNVTLDLFNQIALSVGPKCKEYVRIVAPGLFGALSDSKPANRKRVMEVLNTWVAQTTLRPFLDGEMVPDSLKTGNPNVKSELLSFLSAHLPTAKKLPDGDLKLSLNPIYACLEDRNPEVRKSAQDAILPIMIVLGYETMAKAAQKLTGSSLSNAQSQLDKARGELPAKGGPAPVTAAPMEQDEGPADQPSKPGSRSGSKTRKSTAGKKTNESTPKKDGGVDDDLIVDTKQKNQRFNDENKMRILKWQFTQPRAEYIDQLKEQLAAVTKPVLFAQMFHVDFKQHLKALDSMQQLIETSPEATIGTLDLLLKWCTLRFFDTNPAVLNRVLDYLQNVFTLCQNEGYKLHDIEVNSFVPFLINKAGDSKELVRTAVRNILGQLYLIYPYSKLFVLVLEGTKVKNAKQRAECLDFIAHLIINFGPDVCQPSVGAALKEIGRQVGDKDNGVRTAALTALVNAYMYMGDLLYKHVGSIPDKDMSLLNERIKRHAKNKPLIKKPPLGANKQPLGGPAADSPPKVRGGQQSMVNGVADVTPPKRKGMFQLDMEALGPNPLDGFEMEMPPLIDYSEALAELREPIRVYKSKSIQPPSRKLMSSSTVMEASYTLDHVITQVASMTPATSIQALAQLDELLKDESKYKLLSGHVDQFLQALYFQFRLAYNTHMADENIPNDEVIKLYRNLCMALLALVNQTDLTREASEGSLKDLIFHLITVLLDERLEHVNEGTQVIRSINVMVVKLVERSDPTRCLIALVRLLKDCAGSQNCSKKFEELVMKCLWKHSRLLESVADELNLAKVLQEMHLFLVAFPSASWKERAVDTPLRTIKTILHSLIKIIGADILNHLQLIDSPEESEVVAYLRKALKMTKQDQPQPASSTSGQQPSTSKITTPSSHRPTERTTKSSSPDQNMLQLDEIFKVIGQKDRSKEGLEQLYDYTHRNPSVDLNQYYSKVSPEMRVYISRKLKQIEADRRHRPTSEPPMKSSSSADSLTDPVALMARLKEMRRKAGLDSNTDVTSTSNKGDGNPASKHMERLIELRAQAGLDNTEYEKMGIKKSGYDSSSDVELAVGKRIASLGKQQHTPPKGGSGTQLDNGRLPSTPSMTSADLTDLKARLEKVKRSTATKPPRPAR